VVARFFYRQATYGVCWPLVQRIRVRGRASEARLRAAALCRAGATPLWLGHLPTFLDAPGRLKAPSPLRSADALQKTTSSAAVFFLILQRP